MGKRNVIHAIALSDSSSSSTSSSSATPSADNATTSWAILVQPKTIHKWFRVETPSAVIIDSHGASKDLTATLSSSTNILVKILIGENDIPHIGSRVQEVLHDLSSSPSSPNSESGPESASISWLRNAVGTLQHADLISNFDISEFIQIAEQSVISKREQDQTSTTDPLEIDYEGHPMRQASAGLEEKVAAMKQKEKKKEGWGFWVSHGPNATYGSSRRVARERNSWEREDDAYGGLM